MEPGNGAEPTQPLDPQTEALRVMINALLAENLRPIREQLFRIEEDAKACYVDLHTRLARMQESLDVLNEKFDAQANEVKFLRKSVRLLEDKVDPVTA